MEDKEMNDEMVLPEDGSQPDFDAVDDRIEKEFDSVEEKIEADFEAVDEKIEEDFEKADKMGDQLEEDFENMGKQMEEDFDQMGEDLEERFEAVGEKIEEKMENFGEEMEKVGEKIGAAFEDAFGDVDEDGDNVRITVDKSGKTVHNRTRGGGQAIFWGLAMIAVGAAVILSQLGILDSGYNWWAIFVLVPGLGFLSGSLDMVISQRRFGRNARSMFGTGVLVLTVGAILLFDLSWRIFWPLILLAVGLGMFMNGLDGKKGHKGKVNHWFNRYGLWTGLGVMGLGAAFLLNYLDIFSMSEWYSVWALQFTTVTDGWWGLFLLLPGIGGLLHALIIILVSKRFPVQAILLSVSGVACLAVGIVASMGMKWNLITPFVIIGAGLVIVAGELLHQIVREGKVHTVKGNVDSKIVEE